MEARDGLLEAVALDEPHGVERAAVGVVAQAVDRDDPRVLQPAGDLRLQQEAGPADGVVGVDGLDLLQGHLAVQLPVEGDEDLAQPAPGVRPEDAVARAGHRTASPVGQGDEWVIPRRAGGRDHGQPGLQLGVVAVLLQVLGDQRLEQLVLVLGDGPLVQQDPAQRPGLLQDPGVHGGDQRIARDEVHLQGQDADQQVAVAVGLARGRPGALPARPILGPGAAEHVGDQGGIRREPVPVLLRRRALAAASAPLQLGQEQLAQEGRPLRSRGLPQILLDPRPAARLPGGLEPVADRVDPVGDGGRDRVGAGGVAGAHGDPSAVHRLRIRSSLRSTDRRPQPSRSAICSLL